ncbi:hypothetical protein FF1_010096 [Malus domestica]
MHRHLLGTALNTAAPSSNGNRTADSFINEANFDTNMVIILAALLCALICALGLNSIVRCALRCSHRFALETPEQAAARLAATGLKKSHLRQIPIAVYGSGVNIPATECPICLTEFEDGEKVRVLPKCNHGFHVRCIDTWFLSHSSCPNCRQSLLSTSSTAATAAAAAVAADSSGEAAEAEEESPAATNESSQQGGRVVVVVEQGS